MDGRGDTSHLLPSQPLHPLQPQASHLSLRSDAPAVRSNEPASITVGSIANAYFASAPGEGVSAWGMPQFGPCLAGSQSAAMGGEPGSSTFPSPAALSPSTDRGQSIPSRIPFVSNYMNGIPCEADSSALLRHPSQQLPQQQNQLPAEQGYGLGHHFPRRAGGNSGRQANSSGASNASSNTANKSARNSRTSQQAAELQGRRPKAVANSPAKDAGGKRAQPAGKKSPPRYHEARYAVSCRHLADQDQQPMHDSHGTTFQLDSLVIAESVY